MKCLQKCNIGDILVWTNGQEFKVETVHDGQSLQARETKANYVGTFYDRYLSPPRGDGVIRIIKAKCIPV